MRTLPAVTAALVLLATGCEKKSATPAAPAPAAPASVAAGGDSILVGEIFSLTGGEATFGISSRNGIELAVKEANAAGGVKGKKLETRVTTTRASPRRPPAPSPGSSPRTTCTVILGEVASHATPSPMADVCQHGAGADDLRPSSTNPKVTRGRRLHLPRLLHRPLPGRRDGQVRAGQPEAQQGRGPARREERLLHRPRRRLHARQFTEMGGQDRGGRELQPGRHRLPRPADRHQGAEPGRHLRAGLLHRGGRSSRARPASSGSPCRSWAATAGTSTGSLRLGGSAVEGSYFSNHYSSDDPSPRVQKFVADYKAAYGRVPDALATLAYDAAGVAIDAMRRAPDLSGKSLRDAIAQTKDFPGRDRRHHPRRTAQRGEACGGPQGGQATKNFAVRERQSIPDGRPASSTSSTDWRQAPSTP